MLLYVVGIMIGSLVRILIAELCSDLPPWLAVLYQCAWAAILCGGVLLGYHCELYYNPGYVDPGNTSLVFVFIVSATFLLGMGTHDARREVNAAQPHPSLAKARLIMKRNRKKWVHCLTIIWLLGQNGWRCLPFYGIACGAILMISYGRPHTGYCGKIILAVQVGMVLLYQAARVRVNKNERLARDPRARH